jgi:hypothetical protein
MSGSGGALSGSGGAMSGSGGTPGTGGTAAAGTGGTAAGGAGGADAPGTGGAAGDGAGGAGTTGAGGAAGGGGGAAAAGGAGATGAGGAAGGGGAGGAGGAAGGGGAGGAVPQRTYRLASSGAQLDPARGPQLGDADLATDVDVINVHQDFFGVPWEAFAADTGPPAAWDALMADIARRARATGKEVFLALAPLAGNRADLAANVTADGATFRLDGAWKPPCYDLASAPDGPALRAAYARYVDYMVRLFEPRWTNVAVEVSLFHLTCPRVWTGMAALERDAYAAAKAAAPGTPAFPSIQLDVLYGRVGCPAPMTADQCFEIRYAALADLQRDRFAVSTFPYNFAGFDRPEDVPADWLTRAAARGGERVFVAETGWLGTDLVVTDQNSQCLTAIVSPAAEQAAWFDRLVTDSIAARIEVLNWISNRDFLPGQVLSECPCTFSTAWCDVVASVRAPGTPIAKRDAEVGFKVFGTMGIRGHDGTPRDPIFGRWQAARALPLAP